MNAPTAGGGPELAPAELADVAAALLMKTLRHCRR